MIYRRLTKLRIQSHSDAQLRDSGLSRLFMIMNSIDPHSVLAQINSDDTPGKSHSTLDGSPRPHLESRHYQLILAC